MYSTYKKNGICIFFLSFTRFLPLGEPGLASLFELVGDVTSCSSHPIVRTG